MIRRDVTMAYKTILRAVEMATDPGDALLPENKVEQTSGSTSDLPGVLQLAGWKSRVWWDLKLVSIGRDVNVRILSRLLTLPLFNKCTTWLRRNDFEDAVPSLSPSAAEHVDAVDTLVNQKLTEILGAQALQVWTHAVGAA